MQGVLRNKASIRMALLLPSGSLIPRTMALLRSLLGCAQFLLRCCNSRRMVPRSCESEPRRPWFNWSCCAKQLDQSAALYHPCSHVACSPHQRGCRSSQVSRRFALEAGMSPKNLFEELPRRWRGEAGSWSVIYYYYYFQIKLAICFSWNASPPGA